MKQTLTRIYRSYDQGCGNRLYIITITVLSWGIQSFLKLPNSWAEILTELVQRSIRGTNHLFFRQFFHLTGGLEEAKTKAFEDFIRTTCNNLARYQSTNLSIYYINNRPIRAID